MPTQIFTSVVNRPGFLDLQARLFEKHLTGDATFNVVDDSVDGDVSSRFEEICRVHGLNYIRKPRRVPGSTPAEAAAEAIQWTFDGIIRARHDSDNVLFLDSDMFLVRDFDIDAYIDGYTIAGLLQQRGPIVYLWNGIMFFDMRAITAIGEPLDFSPGRVLGHPCDVGGQLYHYIHRADVRLRETDPGMEPAYPTEFRGVDLSGAAKDGYAFELHCDGHFLHYRAATNWFSNWRGTSDPLPRKAAIFERIVDAVL